MLYKNVLMSLWSMSRSYFRHSFDFAVYWPYMGFLPGPIDRLLPSKNSPSRPIGIFACLCQPGVSARSGIFFVPSLDFQLHPLEPLRSYFSFGRSAGGYLTLQTRRLACVLSAPRRLLCLGAFKGEDARCLCSGDASVWSSLLLTADISLYCDRPGPWLSAPSLWCLSSPPTGTAEEYVLLVSASCLHLILHKTFFPFFLTYPLPLPPRSPPLILPLDVWKKIVTPR